MAIHFADDLDIVDASTIEQSGPLYPVAQWLHGDPKLAAAGGVAHTGGIILPDKYLDDATAPAPGWTRATVAFSSGKSEPVLAAQKPRLAVIRSRFRWFVTYNGVTTYYPRSGYVADSGMRGHLQVLCGIHGFEQPIAITFKGKASQEFERLLRDFEQKIREASARVLREKGKAAANFPRFAFYMRLAPGPHVKVGQKGQESIITPPTLDLPAVIGEDYLSKIYVGRDRLQDLQQHYRAAGDWVAQWDRPGAEEAPGDHDQDDAPPQQRAPQQTAAQAAGVGPARSERPAPPPNFADDDF